MAVIELVSLLTAFLRSSHMTAQPPFDSFVPGVVYPGT